MYVAVKGGEKAIANAHRLLADRRRGDTALPEITDAQIAEQLSIAVARVMAEGSVYDRDLAARAIRQARGDLIEAIFLVRAYRTTLPRIGYSAPIETATMEIERRVSATFKDIPGGQVLGPTFDYTHRLLDFADTDPEPPAEVEADTAIDAPHVMALLRKDGLVENSAAHRRDALAATQASEATVNADPDAKADDTVADLTRQSLNFPADRELRLQNLARGDEGFLLALGYSTQRGYGRTHPFVGEVRYGEVEVELFSEELGFDVPLGSIDITECEMVNQFTGSATAPPQFTRGYGLVFGQSERKAMSMALVDRALRADEFGEERNAPAQDEEFVLSHSDNVQATGFVEHLKLPHYVDFQSELALLRQLRKEHEERRAAARNQEAAE